MSMTKQIALDTLKHCKRDRQYGNHSESDRELMVLVGRFLESVANGTCENPADVAKILHQEFSMQFYSRMQPT